MVIKPSKKYFFIPAGALLLSGIIAISMVVSFIQSLTEVEEIDINTTYVTDAQVDDLLIIFVAEEKLDFEVNVEDNVVIVDGGNTNYTYTITKDGTNDGFYIDTYNTSTSSNLNGYEAAFIINFTEEGTYTITSNAPVDYTIISDIGLGQILGQMFGAIAIGFVGGGIALISFVIIALKRSNYKKRMLSGNQQNQQQYNNEENDPEQKEEEDPWE